MMMMMMKRYNMKDLTWVLINDDINNLNPCEGQIKGPLVKVPILNHTLK